LNSTVERPRRSAETGAGGLAALAVALAACSGSDSGGPVTLTVGSSAAADHATIGEAVAAAAAGSTILVEPGTYVEEILLTKSLTIVGAGPTTIVEPDAANPTPALAAIDVQSTAGVRLEALAVRGPRHGIRIEDADGVALVGVVASANGSDGVHVENSTNISLSGSFSDNADEGVQVTDGSSAVSVGPGMVSGNLGDGVRIELSSGCHVTGLTSSGNGDDGIQLEFSSGSTVTGCTVSANVDDGVLVASSTGTTVHDCTITGNFGIGLHLVASGDTVHSDNTISGNTVNFFQE
jgi:parallel beta-helix repeat protein